MPVAWKLVPPSVQAASMRSTTPGPMACGQISGVTAVDTTFLPDASRAQMSSMAGGVLASPWAM